MVPSFVYCQIPCVAASAELPITAMPAKLPAESTSVKWPANIELTVSPVGFVESSEMLVRYPLESTGASFSPVIVIKAVAVSKLPVPSLT